MLNEDDSISEMDTCLKSLYGANLFDFCYFLVIALTDNVLPKDFLSFKKSYFQIPDRRKYRKLKDDLKSIKDRSEGLLYLESLSDQIAPLIDDINKMLIYTRIPTGRKLSNKSKLILLWAKLFLNPIIDREKYSKLYKRRNPTINWKNYVQLINWFKKRLGKCSYFSDLIPKILQEEEIKNAKSLLQKNQKNYSTIVDNIYDYYQRAQRYFENLRENPDFIINRYPPSSINQERPESTINGRPYTPVKGYPIIEIIFEEDSITIGELSKKEIIRKTISFKNKKKITIKKKQIQKNQIMPYLRVMGEELNVTFRMDDVINEFIKDMSVEND